MEKKPTPKVKLVENIDKEKKNKDQDDNPIYLKKICTKEQSIASINKIDYDEVENDKIGHARPPKKSKHVVLSMAEIKDHEVEKKKDPESMRFLMKRKSFEMNEYPSKQVLEELNENID